MKASAFEFRFRYLLHTVLYVLGFWAPWNLLVRLDPAGPNAHVWGLLAANLAMSVLPASAGGITLAFNILLLLAIGAALAAAAIRTWGGAYLGAGVVQDSRMHTASEAGSHREIITDGPYRFMRNPLYAGTFLHTLALALLMPRSGALFAIVTIGILQIRLILAEEAFLAAKLGKPYRAYCELVPRLVPVLKPTIQGSGRVPRWLQAALGEIYMWAVALSFAFFGWRYNAALLIQCVVVSFGLSFIARAFRPRVPSEA